MTVAVDKARRRSTGQVKHLHKRVVFLPFSGNVKTTNTGPVILNFELHSTETFSIIVGGTRGLQLLFFMYVQTSLSSRL